ncbi:MAG: hypothetical protein ACSHXL_02910 [Bacteroidota bacterium]
MEIKELKTSLNIEQNNKLIGAYTQFDQLLSELKKKEIPENIVIAINKGIDEINSESESDKALIKQIRKTQTIILKRIEKDLKLTPKNHYRNMWLALGMAVIGVPFGVVFGISLKNMSFVAIGIPIGMVIGIAIGTTMDKKALESGKQLDLEIKY